MLCSPQGARASACFPTQVSVGSFHPEAPVGTPPNTHPEAQTGPGWFHHWEEPSQPLAARTPARTTPILGLPVAFPGLLFSNTVASSGLSLLTFKPLGFSGASSWDVRWGVRCHLPVKVWQGRRPRTCVEYASQRRAVTVPETSGDRDGVSHSKLLTRELDGKCH